ncbi:hypothetical protein BH23BAC2_BH23BAC2_22370 [soil metagenome]
MNIENKILKDLDEILKIAKGFQRDGLFHVNGKIQHVDISQVELTDTVFSFNYKDQKLLHFTSYNAAIAILKSKNIRALSLSALNDHTELTHSLNLIHEDYPKLIEAKNYTFVACFTPRNPELKISNYSFHWENYANDHKGIALEFEVIRDPLYPFLFSLNVSYLDKADQNNLLKVLKHKKFNEITLIALLPLLASIKKPFFNNEEEVRLLYALEKESCCPEFSLMDSIGYFLSDENRAKYFFKIPFIFLNEKNENDALLKLNKIYLGKSSGINDGNEILIYYLVFVRKLKKLVSL